MQMVRIIQGSPVSDPKRMPLVRVEGLTIDMPARQGATTLRIVDGVDFTRWTSGNASPSSASPGPGNR